MGLVVSLFKPECSVEIYSMKSEDASSCGKISGGLYALIVFLIGIFISIIIHFVMKKREESKSEERSNRPLIMFLVSILITIVISVCVYFFTFLYYKSQQKTYEVQLENLKSRGINDTDALNIISRSSDAQKMAEAYKYPKYSSSVGTSVLSGLIGGIIGSNISKK